MTTPTDILLEPAQTYRQVPDIMTTMLDGDAVLLNATTGGIFGLNRTASAIWEGFANPTDAVSVAEGLVRRFTVSIEEATESVRRTGGALLAAGMLQPAA